MTLEKQVCSLESAKRLEELGVPQESLFYFDRDGNLAIRSGDRLSQVSLLDEDSALATYPFYEFPTVSAFTASELGEMLPPSVDGRWLTMSKYSGIENMVYQIGYCTANIKEIWHVQRELTEAEARAKMLIYLLENNLIKLCTSQNTKAKLSQRGRRRRSLG